MDENAIIQLAKSKRWDAFNQLVMLYQDMAYNQAFWLVRDPAEAEDVTQEAMVKAYHHLDSYHGGSFRSWLLRIVTNTGLDALRRKKRRAQVALISISASEEEEDFTDWLADPAVPVEEQVERSELSRSVQRYLDELPDEYRRTVYLVDVLELDYNEAARVLGVPVGTVKSRVARGRLQLRKRLLQETGQIPRRTKPSPVAI
ncbi:MAG TPA: sigma-70 family RNA polymerase sigma factor [Levilinea sp.]|nr:sigma-70 family RNA polymerase sigma factor [Levilinea sp.]